MFNIKNRFCVSDFKPACQAKVIFIDGCDNSGKSNQAKLLKERLELYGMKVLLTKSPGGTPIASYIRDILLDPEINSKEEMDYLVRRLLYMMSYVQEIKMMQDNIDKYDYIICDRFNPLSDMIYGYMTEDIHFTKMKKIEILYKMNELLSDYLVDTTLFLNSILILISVDYETVKEREKKRREENIKKADIYDEAEDEFKRKIYNNYNQICKDLVSSTFHGVFNADICVLNSIIPIRERAIVDGNNSKIEVSDNIFEIVKSDVESRIKSRGEAIK